MRWIHGVLDLGHVGNSFQIHEFGSIRVALGMAVGDASGKVRIALPPQPEHQAGRSRALIFHKK